MSPWARLGAGAAALLVALAFLLGHDAEKERERAHPAASEGAQGESDLEEGPAAVDDRDWSRQVAARLCLEGGLEHQEILLVLVSPTEEVEIAMGKIPMRLDLPKDGEWTVFVEGDGFASQAVRILVEGSTARLLDGRTVDCINLAPSGSARIFIREDAPTDAEQVVAQLRLLSGKGSINPFSAVHTTLIDPRLSRRVPHPAASLSRSMSHFRRHRVSREDLIEAALSASRSPSVTRRLSATREFFQGNLLVEVEVDRNGAAVVEALPAAPGYQWILPKVSGATLSPPADESLANPEGPGFVKDFAREDGGRWSGEFSVHPQEVTELEAVIHSDTSISGNLDFSILTQANGISGTVTLFRVDMESNPRGGTLTSFIPEETIRTDASGYFRFSPVAPGKKKISAIWTDGLGGYCIANLELEARKGERHDLGLIQPATRDETVFHPRFVDQNGRVRSWAEIFGPDEGPRAMTLVLNNQTEGALPGEDFWDALYPRMGREVRVIGLSPGDWKILAFRGGSTSMWPPPLPGWRLLPYESEYGFDRRSSSVLNLDFPVAFGSKGGLDVTLYDGHGDLLADSPTARVHVLPLDGGEASVHQVVFDTRNGIHHASLPGISSDSLIIVASIEGFDPPFVGESVVTAPAGSNAEAASVTVRSGEWLEGNADPDLLSSLPVGVLRFQVLGWPATQQAHFMALPDADGAFKLGPVPLGAELREIGLRREFQPHAGVLEMSAGN